MPIRKGDDAVTRRVLMKKANRKLVRSVWTGLVGIACFAVGVCLSERGFAAKVGWFEVAVICFTAFLAPFVWCGLVTLLECLLDKLQRRFPALISKRTEFWEPEFYIPFAFLTLGIGMVVRQAITGHWDLNGVGVALWGCCFLVGEACCRILRERASHEEP
jgi:hypothetical protein